MEENPATGQIIIHLYNPYTQGVTTWISPVFDIDTISVTQYNKIVLDQIKKLVTRIYQEKYQHTENYHKRRPTLHFGAMVNYIVSNTEGEENSELSFFISTDNFSCKPINLQELSPESLCLEEILKIYDEWASKTRDAIVTRYNRGELPVGTTFEIQSEDLLYYTTYPVIPPSGTESQYLKNDQYCDSDEYVGFIN